MKNGNGEETSQLQLLMQNAATALDLMSGGRDQKDEFSLCGFCYHNGMTSCRPPNEEKTGLCPAYSYKYLSPIEIESVVFDQLTKVFGQLKQASGLPLN